MSSSRVVSSGTSAGGDTTIIRVDMTQTGNVGSGEDTLTTFGLPAGTLGNDDDFLEIEAWGTMTSGVVNRQIKLHFGSTVIADSGSSGTNATEWKIKGTLVRTGAATQKAYGIWSHHSSDTGGGSETFASPTETLSGAITIKVTGENITNSTNDVVIIEGFIVKKVSPNANITTVSALNGFRLTAETGVSVSTSDQTSVTTIYLTPHSHNAIALFDSTNWNLFESAEVSLAVGTLVADTNYDVFAFDSSGTVTLEFSAAWTNDTTRSDAISRQDGVFVKTSDTTRRLVGTIRTTSTTTTEDSEAKRFVSNATNRVYFTNFTRDTTDSWTDAGNGTWTAINTSNAAWKHEFVRSLAEDGMTAETSVHVTAAYSHVPDLDWTSGTPDRDAGAWGLHASTTNAGSGASIGFWAGIPGLGYHFLQGVETTGSASTATAFGDNGGSVGGGVSGINSGLRSSGWW